MELLFTRHGETDWNIERKWQGRTDVPLNAKGLQQAEEARNKLAYTPIDLILTSPSIRASKTAEIIKGDRNIEIILEPRLLERDLGEFEGKKYDEFDLAGLWSYKKNISIPQVETIHDFFDRIYGLLNQIKVNYSGNTVLLVSHGGVGIAVQSYFEGIPDLDTLVNQGIQNCEVARFSFDRK